MPAKSSTNLYRIVNRTLKCAFIFSNNVNPIYHLSGCVYITGSISLCQPVMNNESGCLCDAKSA